MIDGSPRFRAICWPRPFTGAWSDGRSKEGAHFEAAEDAAKRPCPSSRFILKSKRKRYAAAFIGGFGTPLIVFRMRETIW